MQHGNTSLYGGSLNANEFLQTAIQKNVLGALCFTANHSLAQTIKAQSKVPCLHIPMQSLDQHEAKCEVWYAYGKLQQGQSEAIQFQHDDDVLFGVINLAESAFQKGDKTSLQQATESAYRQIFSLIERLQFPHIFRFWNYIPNINIESDGLERYRQFNIGRHEAFIASGRNVVGNLPAACALGFNEPKPEQAILSIAFMAGRTQAIAIENPRQLSAYHYPEQYGPVSPTFSRASLVKLKHSELILISGTASIVGHATQHGADAAIQARETMTNIEAVLKETNRVSGQAAFSLTDLHYRVYVRHAQHVDEIHTELIRYKSDLANIEYLQADICRQDLLLEIEASAEYPLPASDQAKD